VAATAEGLSTLELLVRKVDELQTAQTASRKEIQDFKDQQQLRDHEISRELKKQVQQHFAAGWALSQEHFQQQLQRQADAHADVNRASMLQGFAMAQEQLQQQLQRQADADRELMLKGFQQLSERLMTQQQAGQTNATSSDSGAAEGDASDGSSASGDSAELKESKKCMIM